MTLCKGQDPEFHKFSAGGEFMKLGVQVLQDLSISFDGGAPAPDVHALVAAVDRLLAQAHALSPGVYTHAHRYVPSDSVWHWGEGRREVC